MTDKITGAGIGQPLERFEDFALLTGRGGFAADLPVAAGTLHAAILRSPHRPCRDPGDRPGPGIGDAGCGLRGNRRGCPALDPALHRRRQIADRALVPRDRACALSGRAGRGRRRGRPLSGRGRARSDRGRLPSVARDNRSAHRRGARRRQRSALPLRRPGSRLRGRAAPYRDNDGIPAQRLHPARVLCRPRRASPRGERLRGHRQLSGSLGAPPGHGAGARRAGQPATPQDAAGFGRQLWRQAGRLPVYRPDGGCRAQGRAAGQVGRGSARAPARRELGDKPGNDTRSGGDRERRDHGSRVGPDRGLRRLSARPRTGHALPHARQHDRRLPRAQSCDPQPRRSEQQDAERAQSRFRRSASLFRARAD